MIQPAASRWSDGATYIWIDSDQCIRCGACRRICPVDAISLRKAYIARRSAEGAVAPL